MEMILGAIHWYALLTLHISNLLETPLPFQMQLTQNGFLIFDSINRHYPLFFAESGEKKKNQMMFEGALMLLNKNIEQLSYCFGVKFPAGKQVDQLLDLRTLFQALKQHKMLEIKAPQPKLMMPPDTPLRLSG